MCNIIVITLLEIKRKKIEKQQEKIQLALDVATKYSIDLELQMQTVIFLKGQLIKASQKLETFMKEHPAPNITFLPEGEKEEGHKLAQQCRTVLNKYRTEAKKLKKMANDTTDLKNIEDILERKQ